MEVSNQSTGVVFEFERIAMSGGDMPDGLDLAEQMAFTSLRHIYFLYRQKVLSRSKASEEKMKIWWALDEFKKRDSFEKEICSARVEIIKRTEFAKAQCRKNPTEENAIRLCNVLDGLEK